MKRVYVIEKDGNSIAVLSTLQGAFRYVQGNVKELRDSYSTLNREVNANGKWIGILLDKNGRYFNWQISRFAVLRIKPVKERKPKRKK